MEVKYFSAKMVKRNGKLEFKKDADRLTLDANVKNLREGQVVEFMCDFNRDDGTLAQIAKVHQIIRVLAQETGVTSNIIKEEVKRKSNLYTGDKLKSFSVCSKEEMGIAIQTAIELAEFVGISLK